MYFPAPTLATVASDSAKYGANAARNVSAWAPASGCVPNTMRMTGSARYSATVQPDRK